MSHDDKNETDPARWVGAHGPALMAYARLLTRDRDRAEEIVQETFVAALAGYANFAGGSSVRTWLVGILKRKAYDQFHRDKREPVLDDEAAEAALERASFGDGARWQDRPSHWGNPEAEVLRGEFLRLLQACLDGLPPRAARAFWLVEVMEESSEAVCKELAVTATNFWTILHRARLGLRRCLEKSGVSRAV